MPKKRRNKKKKCQESKNQSHEECPAFRIEKILNYRILNCEKQYLVRTKLENDGNIENRWMPKSELEISLQHKIDNFNRRCAKKRKPPSFNIPSDTESDMTDRESGSKFKNKKKDPKIDEKKNERKKKLQKAIDVHVKTEAFLAVKLQKKVDLKSYSDYLRQVTVDVEKIADKKEEDSFSDFSDISSTGAFEKSLEIIKRKGFKEKKKLKK
jgi:hypothetical protein